MDWQSAATQMLTLVLTDRTFPPGFDWDGEWPALLQQFRQQVRTDARIEAQTLRAELQRLDDNAAAMQRLRDLGATEDDLSLLRAGR